MNQAEAKSTGEREDLPKLRCACSFRQRNYSKFDLSSQTLSCRLGCLALVPRNRILHAKLSQTIGRQGMSCLKVNILLPRIITGIVWYATVRTAVISLTDTGGRP
jgi:hypothetical protein